MTDKHEKKVKKILDEFYHQIDRIIDSLQDFSNQEFRDLNSKENQDLFNELKFCFEDIKNWDYIKDQPVVVATIFKNIFGQGMPDNNLQEIKTFFDDQFKVSVLKTGKKGINLLHYSDGQSSVWFITNNKF